MTEKKKRRRPASKGGGLDDREATLLFLTRAQDVGACSDTPSKEETAAAKRIVGVLGGNRAAILFAASRLVELPMAELATLLEALSREESADADAREILKRASAQRLAGRLADAAQTLERFLKREIRDPFLEIDARRMVASVHRVQGKADQAFSHLERALSLSKTHGDVVRRAGCLEELGATCATVGRLAEARKYHEEVVAIARSRGAKHEEGVALSHLAVALHRSGLFEEAKRAHESALEIHRAVGHRRLEGAELMHLGHVEHELGRLDVARTRYDDAKRVLEEVGDRALFGLVLSYTSSLETESKRPERAGPLARQALAIHHEAKSARHEAITWLHLAAHHHAVGDANEAEDALDRVLAHDAALAPEDRAWALALAGRLDDARRVAHEDRATKRALDVLFGATPSARDAPSHRVRLASIMTEARSAGLVVDAEVLRVKTPDGKSIDLARKGPLRRVLALLVAQRLGAPGKGTTWRELLEAGWPEERILADAGFTRVRNALFQLRKLGLRQAILTRDDGYLLDPSLSVRKTAV